MTTASTRVSRKLAPLLPLAMAGAVAFTSAGVAYGNPAGPDVSSWQHIDGRGIDWFAVKHSGHQFAMVKATEGLNYFNPFFIEDCIVMRAAGVARGAYHYAQPGLPPEPQAAFYAATVLGINGPATCPPSSTSRTVADYHRQPCRTGPAAT